MTRALRNAVAALSFTVVTAALAGPSGAVTTPSSDRATQTIPECYETTPALDGGTWGISPVPAFPNGTQAIMGYAPHPVEGDVVAVHNDLALLVSTDGGCDFYPALTLPEVPSLDQPFTATTSRIVGTLFTQVGRVSHLYALIDAPLPPTWDGLGVEVGGNLGTFLMVSDDLGKTWELANEGLPFAPAVAPGPPEPVAEASRPVASTVVASPSDASTMYLASGRLYRSSDAGLTWEAVQPVGRGPAIEEIVVDPIDPRSVWMIDSNGAVRYSADGGETITPPLTPADVSTLDVFHESGSQGRVIAVSRSNAAAYLSQDDGQTWASYPLPAVGSSMAHGDRPFELYLTTHSSVGQLMRLDAQEGWRFLLNTGTPITDVRVVAGTTGALLARSDRELLRYVPPSADRRVAAERLPGPRPCAPEPDGEGAALPRPGTPVLDPAETHLALTRGEERTITYELRLPRTPTPLDVYFLVDTTGSMVDVICGLRTSLQNIAATLSRSGIDVHFGLGEYKTYDDDVPYRRVRDIAPFTPDLVDSLGQLQAGGGGEESQLTALFQSVTGAGEIIADPLGTGGVPSDIPAGLQANFREGAIPLIIHGSDERFGRTGYGPTFAEMISALDARGVLQVGLASGGAAFADLAQVAVETSTLAAAVVDCDGDGIAEFGPGDPLVCLVGNFVIEDGMVDVAPAVVDLIEAIEDRQPVRLVARSDGDVVADIDPAVYPEVDVKEPHLLRFDVTYRCGLGTLRAAYEVDLGALVGPREVVGAKAVVECGTAVPPVPSLDRAVAVALALPPPAPPPLPVLTPQHAPGPQTQTRVEPLSQPANQAQAQAQAGVVAQRQVQPQAAFVHAAQNVREQMAMDHAMVARSRGRDPLSEVKMWAGVMGLAFLIGAVSFVPARTRVREVSHR